MEDLTLALQSALPIETIGHLVLGPTEGLTVVWVNLQERPDLAMLSTRLKLQDGQCTCTWLSTNEGKSNMIIGLRIEMQKPTRSVFHLAFQVEHSIDQLLLLTQTGKIWVMPGPAPLHPVEMQEMDPHVLMDTVMDFAGQGVVIEMEPDGVAELHHLLSEWKLIQ